MKRSRNVSTRAALITLLAPIAWGTTYITVTEFLPSDRPLFVAACRVVPAGLMLLVVGSVTGNGSRVRHDWKQLCILGLFNFGLFFPLLIAAIYRLPGGVAASVGGIQPLLVALVAWLVTSEKPRRFDVFIGAAAVVGVAMVVVRPGASIDPIGVGAAVGANMSFSIGVVLTKKYNIVGNHLTATGLQLLVSAIVIVPAAFLVEGGPPTLSGRNIAGIAYLSAIATGAAFVIWFHGIRRLPRQAPPVLGLAAPITGAAVGWLALDESLTPIQLSGFAIIISAIAYAATIGATETRTTGRSRATNRTDSIGGLPLIDVPMLGEDVVANPPGALRPCDRVSLRPTRLCSLQPGALTGSPPPESLQERLTPNGSGGLAS